MRKSPYLFLLLLTISTIAPYALSTTAIGQQYSLDVTDNDVFAYRLTIDASSSVYGRFIVNQAEEVTINNNNYTARNGNFQTYVSNVWQNQTRFALPVDPVIAAMPIAFGYLGAYNASGIAPEIGYPFILASPVLFSLDQLIENAQNEYSIHNLTVDIAQDANRLIISYEQNVSNKTSMTITWDSVNGAMTLFNYTSTLNDATHKYILVRINKPVVEKSSDISFVQGTTGHSLVWNITVDAILLVRYELYINDDLSYSASLQATDFTDDGWISISGNFDNLLNGTYTIRFIIYDGLGYSVETINAITVEEAPPAEPSITPYITALIVIGVIAVIFIYLGIRYGRKKKSTVSPEMREFCNRDPNNQTCVALRNQGEL